MAMLFRDFQLASFNISLPSSHFRALPHFISTYFFSDTFFSDSPDTLAAFPIYSLVMPTTENYTGSEVASMLAAPAVLSHPAEGGVQVEKSGVIGFGLTVRDAMKDWGYRFAQMIALPKTAST